jgi:hypothetical protein
MHAVQAGLVDAMAQQRSKAPVSDLAQGLKMLQTRAPRKTRAARDTAKASAISHHGSMHGAQLGPGGA